MTFKQFLEFCNERACDGCWGIDQAMTCIGVIEDVLRRLPWCREKYWRDNYEATVGSKLVESIKERMNKNVYK